jgi:hypothetical protein
MASASISFALADATSTARGQVPDAGMTRQLAGEQEEYRGCEEHPLKGRHNFNRSTTERPKERKAKQ